MSLVPFDPMPPAVQARIRSDRTAWPTGTAGADEPEPDAAKMVRNRSIVDEDADRLYGDGVKDCDSLAGQEADGVGQIVRCSPEVADSGGLSESFRREADRLAFLRRVQYVDPRERRT